MVKSLPAQQETWIRSLGWEDPLEKEMATNTSILAWAIPCIEEPGGLQSMGSQESDMTEHVQIHMASRSRESTLSHSILFWLAGMLDILSVPTFFFFFF